MRFVTIILAMFVAFPVNAQYLSPYGMWENYEKRRDNGEWRTTFKPVPKYNIAPGPKPFIYPEEPEVVNFPNEEIPGTILIYTEERTLYYTIDENIAYAYPIAVGRDGFQWTGVHKVSRITNWPDWHPPKEMRQRDPGLPVKMAGGLNNPLGAVAIYIGDTLYRIHGSNDSKSIGTEASSGCFRMYNAHAVHLSQIVEMGATVKVF